MEKKEKERKAKMILFKKNKEKLIKQKKNDLKTKTKKIQKKVLRMKKQKINNSLNLFRERIIQESEKNNKKNKNLEKTEELEKSINEDITIDEYKKLADIYLKNYNDETGKIKKRIENINNKKKTNIQNTLKKIENLKENIEEINKKIVNKNADIYIKKIINHEKNLEEKKKILKKKNKKTNELKITSFKQHRRRMIHMKRDQRDIVDKIKEESDEKFLRVKEKKRENLENIKNKINLKNKKWDNTIKNFENIKDEKKLRNQIYLDNYYKKNYKLDQLKQIEESINNNKAQVLSVFKIDSENLKNNLNLFFGSEKDRNYVIKQYIKNGCKSENLKSILNKMKQYEDNIKEEERLRLEEEKKKKNQENYN